MQEPGTFAGSKFYIGTTVAAANESQFAADTYTEVKNLSNFGEFGGSANITQFPVVSDLYIKKSKGTRNAGDPAIVVGRTSDDPGQIEMREAEQTKFYYNFKLELSDAENENKTNTIIYFRAIVASVIIGTGGNEDYVTETYNLGIYPAALVIESEDVSP